MAAFEEKTGGEVLALAHNGNLSNGRMFPIVESFTGKKIDRAYAEGRMRWEPLYEATQIKGDGETHPLLSPNDEFANFERWDKANLDMSELKKPEMLEFEYARSALKNGLKLEKELGVNPYKFGLVGSTDAHTALAAVEEDNFFGKATPYEPSATRATHPFFKSGDAMIMGWEMTASGYAAVWAQENTREAIFDAMKRRETYATTGPRMVVRFFGGFDFEPKDAANRMPAQIGYTKGVPMGGDLTNAPAGKAPTFLVAALKDPIGANLDRYQIIKGWLDAKGEVHEKIYDVAVSGGREIGADGRCKTAVGNTVDVPNATWTNTIGAPELIAVWKDPDFDPAQRAFYYGRVIEIPTPRWTAYDAKKFGVKMPPEVHDDHDRARLHLADLVYAGTIIPKGQAHEHTPARAIGAFPPAGGRDFRGLQSGVQAQQQRAGKDRRHARADRGDGGGLHPHLAASAHARGTGGIDPGSGARGSVLPRGDGARVGQGRHHHPPSAAAEDGVRHR